MAFYVSLFFYPKSTQWPEPYEHEGCQVKGLSAAVQRYSDTRQRCALGRSFRLSLMLLLSPWRKDFTAHKTFLAFFLNVERTLYKERVDVCRERLERENGRRWCGGGKTKDGLLRELFLKKVKRRLLFLRCLLMPARLNVRGLEVLWLFLILWQLLQEKEFLFKFILLNLSKTCFLVTPEGVRSCALCREKSWDVAA